MSDFTTTLLILGVILGGLGSVLGGLSVVLHAIAPHTKTTIDDTAAADIDKVHDKLDALTALLKKLAPPAAMLLVLVLAASTMIACAGTGATVKKEASYLEGCSTADAATIINAGKAIADDAKALKAGGDRATAAIDVIAQLALVQTAWQHCKSTAGA